MKQLFQKKSESATISRRFLPFFNEANKKISEKSPKITEKSFFFAF